MPVFESVLLDVYKTRLYLPLFVLGVIFLVSPRFRAAFGRLLEICSKSSPSAMAAVMFVITLLLSVLVCYDGKSWGGDFSQYFAQTRALAEHSVEAWYAKNIFIIDTSAEGIGSDVYPWFWSILLLPVYRLFGFYIPLLKVYEALYFAAGVALLVFLLRRRLNGKQTFWISLAIACNLTFLMDVNTVESDLPSMCITLLVLNVMDLYHRKEDRTGRKLLQGIFLGILLFFACETKTMNKALLLALLVYDVILAFAAGIQYLYRKNSADGKVKYPAASSGASNLKRPKGRGIRPSRQSSRSCKHDFDSLPAGIKLPASAVYLRKLLVMAMPFVCYGIVSRVFYSFLPKSGGTYNDYFEFTIGRLQENITGYFEILGGLVCATSRPVIAVVSYTAASVILVLAVIGIFSRLRKELYLVIYLGGTMCMLLFYDYMGARFLFAIYPLLLLFACYGYGWLREKLEGGVWADKGLLLLQDGCFLYLVILLVSFGAVAFSVQTGQYFLRQADSVWAEEFYAYVNDNLSDDSVVYFFKPRVLYLYTGVNSYNWYNETDHMDAADYIAVCEEDGYDRVHAYAKEHGTLVFENEMFGLYEMPHEL